MEHCLVAGLFFSVSLLVSLFSIALKRMIFPLNFLTATSKPNNSPSLLILLFGTGSHDQVVEKEVVDFGYPGFDMQRGH